MSFADNTPDQTQRDLIDLLTEASQKYELVEDKDGNFRKVLVPDPETSYFMTRIVDSEHFSRLVFELKNFERLGKEAKNHMSENRASILESQINELVLAYKYSIDAKSSETRRDKLNSKSCLVDKLNRVKVEKVFSMKENAKSSILASLVGNDKKNDND